LSARAAHHYNDLLTKRKNSKSSASLKQTNDQSVRFAEPSSSPQKMNNTDTQTTNRVKTKKKKTSPEDSPPQSIPESFRRYAHKNLLLCTTDTQQKGMQELLTMTMESSIKKQSFHSTNWDLESLLPVPGGKGGGNFTSNPSPTNTSNKTSNVPSLKKKHTIIHAQHAELSRQNLEGGTPFKEQQIPTVSKVLKKIESINEQKKTTDDWYGGGDSTKDNSQSACITFQPKVFKKKRKNGWAMNARRWKNSRMETSDLAMKERENDKFSKSLNITSCALPQDISSESVAQFESHETAHKQSQSKLEQQQTVSDWYNTQSPPTSIPASTESIKKESNLQDQQQTLNDWYGGENSTDSKNNGEATITFKPKPMKKKKKNRKYMKRSLAAAKSTKEKKNVDDAPQNGILMLPRVQSISNDYRNFNGMMNKERFTGLDVNKEKDYHLRQNSNVYGNSKMQSPPTQHLIRENKTNETKATSGGTIMEEYYSNSKRIKEECRPPKKKIAEKESQKGRSSPLSTNATTFCHSGTKKSTCLSHDLDSTKNKMAHRATRFAGPGGISAAASSNNRHLEYNKNTDKYMGKSVIGGTLNKTLTEEDYEKMTVKGCCQVLEKSYLRLTSPPRAELVRSQEVLTRHLQNLKQKWRVYRENLYSPASMQESNGDELSYTWFCSQFKAIRQDLTVQRIFNAFSVDVYETHAKIALQENDLNEYNQSQTQLKELYFLLTHQASVQENCLTVPGLENHNEFIAYRIIYYIFLTGNQKYDGGSSDLLKIMISLTPAQRKDSAIVHALKVRVAVAEHDYHSFFRLQDVCPNLGAYLMDTLVPQVRSHGLRHMIHSYRPTIAAAFVLKEIGFSVDEADDEGGKTWLRNCGCKFSDDGAMIITKKSILNETHLAGVKSSSLI